MHRKDTDNNGMSKTVNFTRLKDSEFLVASFYSDAREVHSKILNNTEIFGLSSLISFDKVPFQYDAMKLLQKIDKIYSLAPNSEPTGFELLLVDLIYKR